MWPFRAPWLCLVDAKGLGVYRRQRWKRGWTMMASFTVDGENTPDFASWLARGRAGDWHLLLDLADSPLLRVVLPSLPRRDRHALLERRLQQHFPERPWRGAQAATWMAGQEPENAPESGVKSEKNRAYLLMAAPQTELLMPLARAGVLPQRCTLLAQCLPALFGQHWPGVSTAVFLVYDGQTLHQALLHAGQLQFARQTPCSATSLEALLREADGLVRYLASQPGLPGALDGRAHWPLYVLTCQDWSGDPQRGVLAGLVILPRFDRQIWLRALDGSPSVTNVLPVDVVRAHRQRRGSLWALGLALLGLCAGLSGAISAAISPLQHSENRGLQASVVGDPASVAPSSVPPAPKLTEMEAEVFAAHRHIDRHYQAVLAHADDFAQDLHAFSHILDNHPAVRLQRFDWQLGAGQQQWTFQGRLDGSDAPPEAVLRPLVAALTVDPARQAKIVQHPGAEVLQHSWRGRADMAVPPPEPRFVITWTQPFSPPLP